MSPPESHHEHGHSHAPGEHVHVHAVVEPSHRSPAPTRPLRPQPAVTLMMQGAVRRLLGAAGLAVLLWLAVAWALKDAA